MNPLPVAAVAIASTLLFAIPQSGIGKSDVGAAGVAYFRQKPVTHQRQGMVESWRGKLLLARRAQKVGTSGIACIFVASGVRECYGTFILPLGRIKVLGEMTNTKVYQFAIVGGTGRYSGATGIASVADELVTFYIA